jgi:predicted acylesterase/phospholipase RssA
VVPGFGDERVSLSNGYRTDSVAGASHGSIVSVGSGLGRDDPETPPIVTTMRSRLNSTYTGYSIGCAAVWAALLATGRAVLDAKEWDRLRLGAAGWWAGWLSATIARIGYPPPRKLTEVGERRLQNVSLVLVLLGFVNFFRLLITGRRRAGGPAD